ncbi:hypothetical protein FHU10_0559 [Serratia fonticola]|uniref:Uncharacterized protein n=1 Tax=Serratia fonticola TaxID=47917 RepID=A0A542BLB1_SERFO|nr:hypothetical protein FHU09_1891 [Serratia fonticola]TQI98612.1 hypothetical protein FHU11_4157 [Serratia fonticola]TVZ68140.1 hypothetical protein FHU10_0559 [Serratia fonticola]
MLTEVMLVCPPLIWHKIKADKHLKNDNITDVVSPPDNSRCHILKHTPVRMAALGALMVTRWH